MAEMKQATTLYFMRRHLWRRSFGVLALYGVSLYVSAFLFGNMDLLSLGLSVALLLTGILAQSLAFGERFFFPTFFSQRSAYIQDATVYGMEFQATNAWHELASKDLALLLIKVGVVLLVYVSVGMQILKYFSFSLIGATLVGATCVIAFNSQFLWLPAALLFANFMWNAASGRSHVVNITHVAVGLLLFSMFLA